MHDCVMIPDLGGFLLNTRPAGFSTAGHELFPASKTISFNRNLDVNDGLLAQHIAVEENITYSEALIRIKSEADRIKYYLGEGQSIKFEGVGSLNLSQDNKILFSPDNTVNYLKASFGLPTLLLNPVEKQVPTKMYHLPERKLVSNTARPIKVKGATLISVAASLLLVFLVFYKNYNIDPGQVAKAINAHQAKTSNSATSFSIIPKDLSAAIFQGETKNTEPAPSLKFYIVGGSFKKEANARLLVKQLKEKGYEPQMLNTENGFYRVTYKEENDSMKADAELHKIKINENQGAWLLKW